MGRRLPGSNVAEKLALNTVSDGDCLRWTGAHTPRGYGQLVVDGKSKSVHRLAHEIAYGPVPDGHEVDHVAARGCKWRDCVNPQHLEAVIHADNLARIVRTGLCSNGHEIAGANIKWRNLTEREKSERGRRTQKVATCRRCFNDKRNAWRARRKDQANG